MRSTKWMFRFLYGRWIPSVLRGESLSEIGSDSSMVDEYPARNLSRQITNKFRFLYGRWIRCKSKPAPNQCHVQIPLWSMNTLISFNSASYFSCSDSSMVDEYLITNPMFFPSLHVQIPLWSMNTLHDFATLMWYREVQIPLWSMNTIYRVRFVLPGTTFRFLYGRWIPGSTLYRLCKS